MTELGPTNDGRFWYGYDFTGTAGAEYLIQVDAGAAVTDSELRFVSFWAQEEYTPTDIATQVETAIITEGDGQAVLQAIADKIGNENVSAATIASAVRSNLSTELARIDAPISSRATPGDLPAMITPADIWEYANRTLTSESGGGSSSGGGGAIYVGGGQMDTSKIERTLKAVEDAMKKDPDRFQKALEKAQKETLEAIKKLPAPNITVKAPDLPQVTVPTEFLQEIRTAVNDIKTASNDELQKNTEKYDAIVTLFKKTVLSEITKAVVQDKQ